MLRSFSLYLIPLFLLIGCSPSNEKNTRFQLHDQSSSGLKFENTIHSSDSLNILNYIYFYNGGGVGVGDINNDGLEDVFFAGNLVSSKLFLNQGDLKFKDISDLAGVSTEVWCTGVSMIDINEDGFLDIYISVAGSPVPEKRANLLFVNNGDLTFTESAKSYGFDHQGYTTHSAFFDYDLDGDLDLYVMNHDEDRTSLNTPVQKKLNGEGPTTDVLYRNDGNNHFTDVSAEAGILIEGYGLGLAINDFNEDGLPDIYVANDFITNDLMYINRGDGSFTNEISTKIREQSYNGMGVDVADFNNDGLQDIMVLDMLPPDPVRTKTMAGSMSYDKFMAILRMNYEPQYVRNTLQLNRGSTFQEIGRYSGIHRTDWSWAPLFMDADGDGWKDVFISNGYLKDITDKDFMDYENNLSFFKDSKSSVGETLKRIDEQPGVKIPNYFFSNNKDLTFTDQSEEWGISYDSYSNGAAYADLDNDGDLDLLINNINHPAFLYENKSESHHYLNLLLKGPKKNPSAIGSKIEVYAHQTKIKSYHNPYRGFMSSVSFKQTLGLGDVTLVDSLVIRWTDGKKSVYYDIEVDQSISLSYDSASFNDHKGSTETKKEDFEPLSIPGLSLEYSMNTINEFKVQPLIPHKLLKNNPVMATGDFNGDGEEDLFIGGVVNEPSFIFFQNNGKFRKNELPELRLQTINDAAVADFSGDGIVDLFLACGNPLLDIGDPKQQDRLYLGGETMTITNSIPKVLTYSNTVSMLDINEDGALDLFIGSGPNIKDYPSGYGGWFLINQGKAVFKMSNDSLGNFDGYIYDAVPIDIDNDGDSDLIIASDWSPLYALINENGNFSTKHMLNEMSGFWRKILSIDLDQDGDKDLIAANIGLNSPFTASMEEPIRLYLTDLNGNGKNDPLITHFINGKESLLSSRELLFSRYPFYSRKFKTHLSFAQSSIKDIIGEEAYSATKRLEVNDLNSKVFINHGEMNFVAKNLPGTLQLNSFDDIIDANHGESVIFSANQEFLFYDGQTFGSGPGVMTGIINFEQSDYSDWENSKILPDCLSMQCITIKEYGSCMVFVDKKGKLEVWKVN